MAEKKIRVMIVDDSPLMRDAIQAILTEDQMLEVIATAGDGLEAVKKAEALKPDVITMDLKMPMMGGLEAIEEIMAECPIPIVVVSSVDVKVIIKALGIGALDFVSLAKGLENIGAELLEKVRLASRIKPLRRLRIRPVGGAVPAGTGPGLLPQLVGIGASTGGTQALQAVLAGLPGDLAAAILVVQHMSQGFIEGLAEWLNNYSPLKVVVAKDNDLIRRGLVYLAPDDFHLTVTSDSKIKLATASSRPTHHRPSVDALFESLAAGCGRETIGVIMTGMGSDGVEGIKAIKAAGGRTIAQDEKTSVIFGMNKMAIDTGSVDKIVALENIAGEIADLVKGGRGNGNG